MSPLQEVVPEPPDRDVLDRVQQSSAPETISQPDAYDCDETATRVTAHPIPIQSPLRQPPHSQLAEMHDAFQPFRLSPSNIETHSPFSPASTLDVNAKTTIVPQTMLRMVSPPVC